MTGLRYEQCVCEFDDAAVDSAPSGTSSAAMDALAAAIEARLAVPGLAIVPGNKLQELSDRDLSAWFKGLACLLGTLVPQNLAGETLVEIAAQAGDAKSLRGYQTSESMLLHSDASDVAALLCLSPAEQGGINLFVQARTVHDEIAAIRPELVGEYFEPWRWNVLNLGLTGSNAELISPIFSVHAGKLSCRYGSYFLRSAGNEAHPLTPLQLEALDVFEAVTRRQDLLLRYRLRRGDSVWMNNYTLLHGREAFQDAGATPRRYQRCWIRSRTPPNVGASFAVFDATILAHYAEKWQAD
ncbi:TauD/TfdA family dioxygenase [Bradyrhizobium sp. vgs-9]|uniref:TauD/TfdA family dioxygenase n=1 Tax=Bradyrhizobium sp. vgs-9 TaxID=208389 RepID=UPI0035D4A558